MMPLKRKFDPHSGRVGGPKPTHEVWYTNKRNKRRAQVFRTKAAADRFAESCKKKGYTHIQVY